METFGEVESQVTAMTPTPCASNNVDDGMFILPVRHWLTVGQITLTPALC